MLDPGTQGQAPPPPQPPADDTSVARLALQLGFVLMVLLIAAGLFLAGLEIAAIVFLVGGVGLAAARIVKRLAG